MIDKAKLEGDKRLPVRAAKADNGNYIWIQAFYSALARQATGFVMANSAADAGGTEPEIRRSYSLRKRGCHRSRWAELLLYRDAARDAVVLRPWQARDRAGGQGAVLDARKLFRQIDRAHGIGCLSKWSSSEHSRLYRGERSRRRGFGKADVSGVAHGVYTDVPGLCAVATLGSGEAGLEPEFEGGTSGSPERDDDGVDFRLRIEELNEELERLNVAAAELQGRIAANVVEIPGLNSLATSHIGDLLLVKHGFASKGEYFQPEGEQLVLTPGNFKIGGGLQQRQGKERLDSGSYPRNLTFITATY